MTIGLRADASGTFGVVDVGGVDVLKFGAGAAGDALEVAKKTDIPATYTQNQQEFTASGTFNVPAGVTEVYLTGIGGGGSGGTAVGASSVPAAATSGAPGAMAIRKKVSVTPGDAISVTIGGAGGTTSFGALLSLSGGASGVSVTATSTSNNVAMATTSGQVMGLALGGGAHIGGSGSPTPFGRGGAGGQSAVGGAAAANSGAGGGGGGTNGTVTRAGGAGGSGYLLVEW